MKKRILALLMAAMITATMAACDSSTGERDETGGSEPSTEQTGGNTNTGNTGNTGNTDAAVTWQDTNDTVYVIGQNLFLTDVNNSQNVQAATQFTKLTRLKKGSNGKSIVVLGGVQYYALTSQLTTDDLLGETFTACEPTIMYISENGVAIRKYATKSSALIETVNQNDTVQVIAKGTKWVKIQYDADHQYFVNAAYVSETEVVDANDITNYPEFTPVTEAFDLYVVEGMLTLRLCPSTASNEVITLEYGDKLQVLKTGTVEGDLWYQVKFTKPGGVGQGLIVKEGYVMQSRYVSTTNPMPSLDEKLEGYTAFTKMEPAVTMYVSLDAKSLNARSTPDASNADNIKFSIAQKSAVKVVATGSQNGIYWAMIEYENHYYFVSHAYLTASEDGTPAPMTLDQVLAAYPAFSRLNAPMTVAAKAITNCNPKPEEQVAGANTVQLTEGEVVTVEAQGQHGGKTWYIFKKGNVYYFAGAEMFDDSTASIG